MKYFPNVPGFDFKAVNHAHNLLLLVAETVALRTKDYTWSAIEEAYKASKYNNLIGWWRVYQGANKIIKGPKAIAEQVKQETPEEVPTEAKAAPETKTKAVVTLESFFGVEGEKADLLRKLIVSDLQSEGSVILAEIENKLKGE